MDGPDAADLHPPWAPVRDVVGRALAEDLGPLGDVTAALVAPGARGRGRLVARAPGVLAGTRCADEVWHQLGGTVAVTWSVPEGAALSPGDALGSVDGDLRTVLTGERTALNFLCHLSGVATLTRRYADVVAAADPSGRCRVWDTRKTLPGLRAMEKAAVRAGGGLNHRGSLSDMVLVKDNHLAGVGIAEAVARARSRWPGRGVEVECDRLEQVAEAVGAGADLVLVDNMGPDEVAACVAVVAGRCVVEVSGGVTLETAGALARAGADLISTSQITQSAPALDIGLDLTVDDPSVDDLTVDHADGARAGRDGTA